MLNICKTFYAAWTATQSVYDLPEAEIAPMGKSAAETKKVKTLSNKFPNSDEYDNIPMPGFTLYKSNRKHWGSTDQTWLIIDPRGFLVRITQENLEKILHVTGITEGLIQEKCVWARDNSATKMSLIPVTSPDYIEAVKNTEMLDDKIDLKDVQIGDEVLLQNKLVGKYLGVMSLYGPVQTVSSKIMKPSVYLRRQVVEVMPGKFHYQTDVKILKVTKKTDKPMTREEAVTYVNSVAANPSTYFTNHTMITGRYYSNYGKVVFASVDAVPKPKLKFEEISYNDAVNYFHRANVLNDAGMLLLEKLDGKQYIVDMPYYTSSSTPPTTPTSFSAVKIQTIDLSSEPTDITLQETITGWGMKSHDVRESLDSFEKYYKIVKCVKNNTYFD